MAPRRTSLDTVPGPDHGTGDVKKHPCIHADIAHGDRAASRARTVLGLRAYGLEGQAKSLEECCGTWEVRAPLFSPEDSKAVPWLCKHRLCPTCSRAKADRIRRELGPVLESVDRLRFLTLTQQSRAGESVRKARQRFNRSFTKLRRTLEWKGHVVGFLAAREETFNDKRGHWHSHAHIVCHGVFWPQGELAAAWANATGQDIAIADVRACSSTADALREVAKYVTKVADLPLDRIAEYAREMKGLRNLSTGGDWHRVRTDDEGLDGTDLVDDEETPAEPQAEAPRVVVEVAELYASGRMPCPAGTTPDFWRRALEAVARQALRMRATSGRKRKRRVGAGRFDSRNAAGSKRKRGPR